MTILFLHGVPDTPDLWTSLIEALDLSEDDYLAPALPGFGAPRPKGFSGTKEAYLAWFTELVEKEVAASGPVDLVGHDWGGAFVLRLASTRPELVNSWVVMGTPVTPSKRWHKTARIWQTPVYGEVVMALTGQNKLKDVLASAGMPPDLAASEASAIDWTMKRSILDLYRSAKTDGDSWTQDLSTLPDKGLLIWGEKDPYIKLRTAQAFSESQPVPLHVEEGAGHWVQAERPESVAARLREFWG